MTVEPPATVVVPIRSFSGMSRLSAALSVDERRRASRALATRLLDAVGATGLGAVVVTADDEVSTWAAGRADVVQDDGTGLDEAARAGVAGCDGPWLLVHGDLPLVDAAAIEAAVTELDAGTTVLVPSSDGGTTVIGGIGPFPFSFGSGSFHRHLAARPLARVIVDPRLGVDMDTVAHWRALGGRVGAP